MPTLEEIKQTEWFNERPQVIKDLICQFPYAASVRIKATTQIAYVLSWFENGTMRLVITEGDNRHVRNAMEGNYTVFGYKPDDLEFLHENPDLVLVSEVEDD